MNIKTLISEARKTGSYYTQDFMKEALSTSYLAIYQHKGREYLAMCYTDNPGYPVKHTPIRQDYQSTVHKQLRVAVVEIQGGSESMQTIVWCHLLANELERLTAE